MAQAAVPTTQLFNRLYNGDFIDLTSEPGTQNAVEDDVILVDSPGENKIPLPIGASRANSNSPGTKQVGNFVVRNDYPKITTKEFLASAKPRKSFSPRVDNKFVVSPNVKSPGGKKDVVTISVGPNAPKEAAATLQSILKRVGNKTVHNISSQLVSKKSEVQTKSVTPKSCREIRMTTAKNVQIESRILLPSPSEIAKQPVKIRPSQIMVPSQSRNVVKDSNKRIFYVVPSNDAVQLKNVESTRMILPKDASSISVGQNLRVLDKNTVLQLPKNNILVQTPTQNAPRITTVVKKPKLVSPELTRSFTNNQEVRVIEDDVTCLKPKQTEAPKIILNDRKHEVVGFLVYAVSEDAPSSLLIPQKSEEEDDEEPEIIETIEDDDEEIIERKEELVVNNEEILIDPVDDDPLGDNDMIIEPSSVVTPVDISKILNDANEKKAKVLEDRCKCNNMKKQSLVYKGFTKREMRKPVCYKYLQTLIKLNKARIEELKKSTAAYEDNFIHCGRSLNNFLPEVSKCEDDDSDDYTIEYSNIDANEYSSQLPIISNVISKVNEEVIELNRQTADEKMTGNIKSLGKPEEALKLIKKGLELIRSWTKETQPSKEKAKKSPPVQTKRRTRVPKPVTQTSPPKTRTRGKKIEASTSVEVLETKRKRKPKVPFDEEPISEPTARKKKVEPVQSIETEANAKPKSRGRGRKRQKVECNEPDPNDNELFVIKKVDILSEKRRRRRKW